MQKQKLKKGSMVVLAASLALGTAACGNDDSNNANGSAPASTEAASQASGTASAAPKADPLGKYETPIEVTVGASVDTSVVFQKGEDIDNNVWTKEIESALGIKIKHPFVVDETQYANKLNVIIASDELPDVTRVGAQQLRQLVEADAIMDLTDIYDQYGSEQLKKVLAEDNGVAIGASTFKGKLMAIPIPNSADINDVLWVRQDWLENLGLSAPKTMDEFFAVAKAFSENDPDQNGKDDTYGFGINKSVNGWGLADAIGVFNGYGVYPEMWQEKDGKLEYGSIQPEVKDVLAKLADMYEAKILDPEFSVKDEATAAGDQAAQKGGMMYGATWAPYYPLGDTIKNNAKARWVPVALPSADGSMAKDQVDPSPVGYYVVRKDAKNPEAALKLANFFAKMEAEWDQDPALYAKFHDTEVDDGNGGKKKIELFKYAPVMVSSTKVNLAIHQSLNKAIEAKDRDSLSPSLQDDYDRIVSFMDKQDVNNWGDFAVFGPTGSYHIVDEAVKQNAVFLNAFTGGATETMGEKKKLLEDLEVQTFTKIIMGAAPVDEFDKFVEQWKSQGGQQITDEVNEWYASKQ